MVIISEKLPSKECFLAKEKGSKLKGPLVQFCFVEFDPYQLILVV